MPMKNLFTGAGVTLLLTTVASIGLADISLAQEKEIAPQSLPGNYGIVRAANGEQLDVRLLDGTNQSYSLPEGSSHTYKQGDLIGFDVNEAGLVSKVQPPEVDEVLRGTVTAVNPESQTVTLVPEGTEEPVDTRISQGTISKLSLEPGKEVMVTKYKNTWASKVCLPQAAAPVVEPPVEEPVAPLDDVEPAPVSVPDPIPALW